MSYLQRYYDHVPLHRLWTFATLQDDLNLSEHAHILDCERCQSALRVCLKAENFGAVLKELQRDGHPSDQASLDFERDS